MKNALLLEIGKILENKNIFDVVEKKEIFYSYFLANQKYFLFCYSEKSISTNFIYESVEVISKIDSKKRQIRSINPLEAFLFMF